MATMTSVEAQNHFGELLETAQREAVVITRHGRPAVFVVSSSEMADLLELKRMRKQAVREFAAWRRQAKKTTRRAAGSLTDVQISQMVRTRR
ncbi:Prevent-host-death family protein [Candidatus Sulfotelmatomonas gaucii]|uniref:Antitoxin n=1 Tax=Candidatus Sulfuritelmatomonas gaucii TaxID=2043161 RepID=A0A2N9L7G1_9BACT|nr:Prevent-host-death family protein [Candidatus Sulfotelmatomonas gaucii]